MNPHHSKKNMFKRFQKIIIFALITAFVGSSLYMPQARAGEMVMPLMPKPGTMVNLSPDYIPAHLQGITIHTDNALQFDFLIHKGEGNLNDAQKKQEYNKLVKYFLASLTIPDEDQWVNLSPYERNRIIKDDFGKTEMGRDLLTQDYLLKQITSSLMYPESGLGKKFWDRVYERAEKEFGSTNIPVNTFNKVWITPDEAIVYESGNTAYIIKSHLKVMLEEDYLSLNKHTAIENPDPKQNVLHSVSSKVIKDIILPEIEKEVNEGKNFAMLRQIYSGMVLATWYKRALKGSLLGKVYADKAKIAGIVIPAKEGIQKIDANVVYQRYLKAFKKGVFNYIKEDVDTYSQQVIPRKYFAGGFVDTLPLVEEVVNSKTITISQAMLAEEAIKSGLLNEDDAMVNVSPAQSPSVEAMLKDPTVVRLRILTNLRLASLNRPGFDKYRNIAQQDLPWVYEILGHFDEWRRDKINNGESEPNTFELTNGRLEGDLTELGRYIDEVAIPELDAAMTVEQKKPNIVDFIRRFNVMVRFKQSPSTIHISFRNYDVEQSGFRAQDIRSALIAILGVGVGEMREYEQGKEIMFPIAELKWDQIKYKISWVKPEAVKPAGTAQTANEAMMVQNATETGQPSPWGRFVDVWLTRDLYKYVVQVPLVTLTLVGSGVLLASAYPSTSSTGINQAPIILADKALITPGGIDLNSANLDLQIKRDGRGVPLPLAQQDMAQLSRIQGFVPVIIEIKPVTTLAFLSELQQKFQRPSSPVMAGSS